MVSLLADKWALLEDCTSEDEDSLLLSFHPLNDPICALCKGRAGYSWSGYTIKLEKWRDPSERDAVTVDTVQHFEMIVLGVRRSVQSMV